MKCIKVPVFSIILCVILSGCSMVESRQTNFLGFEIGDFTTVEEADTHGGFHGDGSYYLILDCSENATLAREIVKDWKPFPLTESLELAMYGGTRGIVSYDGYRFAEEAHWPRINNGVYRFVDRHSDSTDQGDDTDLLNRASFNFTIAAYDFDTNRLYYFEMDT